MTPSHTGDQDREQHHGLSLRWLLGIGAWLARRHRRGEPPDARTLEELRGEVVVEHELQAGTCVACGAASWDRGPCVPSATVVVTP